MSIADTFAQSTPVTNGYRDFNYGSTVNSTPTGEKPQSKLWWNDGIWWGSLWDPSAKKYTIHRFDKATQSWTSTGTAIDDRGKSKADALWDGQKLYVASQIYTTNPGPTTSDNAGRLYRFSYNSSSKSYTLDSGFPVNVNSSISETLVLEKDSSGQLWVTWTEGGNAKVNRSLSDDLTWGQPFTLPGGTNLDSDDISSIIAFDHNKIGVMWSNQNERTMYFAVHLDSDPDDVWQIRERGLYDPSLGGVADDHINLKLSADDDGAIYAVTKTSLSGPEAPLIYLLKRTAIGSWSRYVFGKVKDGHTRPILLVDSENKTVYVFAMSDIDGTDAIYMKSSSTNNIVFPSGAGTPFIKSSTDLKINNPTATKQNINGTTGLLVLASDNKSHYYLHNYLELPSGSPSVVSFTPIRGAVGTEVTITGSNFTGATAVAFNGTIATIFTVDSDTQIRANVPSNATTGKISVTNTNGTGTSAENFILTHTLTVAVVGSGNVTLDPAGGVYDEGTVVTLTASPDPGWAFSNWSGDLTGSTNPATITMSSNKSVTATFVPQYNLTVNTVGSGSVTLNPPGGIYSEGTVVTLTANPDPGWVFSNWSGDLTGANNPETITMNSNKSVTATFTESPVTQYTLTINTIGSGNVSLNPPGGLYNEGTLVTLTANPDPGWVFTNWSGDLTGSVNPTTITMNANHTVIATFTENAGTGTVTYMETRTGGSTLSISVATTTSLTAVNDDLYLAAISARANIPVNSVSGLGLSWSRIDAQCAGRNQTGIEVWMAIGVPSGSGPVTATFTQAPSNAVIAVSRYSGVDPANPIGNVLSGNTNGLNGACSGGVDNSAYSFNLTTTANGAMALGAAAMRNKTHTPGAGYTERAEIMQGTGGSIAGLAVEDQSVSSPSTIAVNGSFSSSVDWAMIGLEIKPQVVLAKRFLPSEEEDGSKPSTASSEYRLEQNYPNPFNPATNIRYALPEAEYVELTVYDINGRTVAVLVNGFQNAGTYTKVWEAVDNAKRPLPSGIYFYQLRAGSHVETFKMILAK